MIIDQLFTQPVFEAADPSRLIVSVRIEPMSTGGEPMDKEVDLTGQFQGSMGSQMNQALDYMKKMLESKGFYFTTLRVNYQGKSLGMQNRGSMEPQSDEERDLDSMANQMRAKQSKQTALPAVKEVAPPGAKAERMVKHIKQGYARDGKLTPKEKGIAFATAWKAHNAGHVEEATGDERFDSMMGQIQREPTIPDSHMPPTDVKDLYHWAVKHHKPYHKIFAKWANREGFKSVAPALQKAGNLDSDALDYWTPDVWKLWYGPDSEMPRHWSKERVPEELRDYLETVFDAYDRIVFDWPTEYRQISEQGVTEMDKGQPSAGRDTGPREGPEKIAKPITKEKMVKHALDALSKSMAKKDDTKKDVKESDSLMLKLKRALIKEGRVKELALDLKTMSDADFMKKYGKAKAAIRKDMKRVDEAAPSMPAAPAAPAAPTAPQSNRQYSKTYNVQTKTWTTNAPAANPMSQDPAQRAVGKQIAANNAASSSDVDDSDPGAYDFDHWVDNGMGSATPVLKSGVIQNLFTKPLNQVPPGAKIIPKYDTYQQQGEYAYPVIMGGIDQAFKVRLDQVPKGAKIVPMPTPGGNLYKDLPGSQPAAKPATPVAPAPVSERKGTRKLGEARTDYTPDEMADMLSGKRSQKQIDADAERTRGPNKAPPTKESTQSRAKRLNEKMSTSDTLAAGTGISRLGKKDIEPEFDFRKGLVGDDPEFFEPDVRIGKPVEPDAADTDAFMSAVDSYGEQNPYMQSWGGKYATGGSGEPQWRYVEKGEDPARYGSDTPATTGSADWRSIPAASKSAAAPIALDLTPKPKYKFDRQTLSMKPADGSGANPNIDAATRDRARAWAAQQNAPGAALAGAMRSSGKPVDTAKSKTDWKSIYNLNKSIIGDNPNRIRPGMKLKMPNGSTYSVQSGDTLSKIAGNQINELSTNKLAQYKTAAAKDAKQADQEGDFKRGDKRFHGIVQATKKQFDNDAKKVDENRAARRALMARIVNSR